VIVLSALPGAVMMLGLAVTLPASRAPGAAAQNNPVTSTEGSPAALWWLSGAVMFVLAGFELGIVLQGQQHTSLSSRQVAMMFAECSLVMLGVNALLFFTSLLEKISARSLMGAGLILAMIGLAVLAQHRSEAWMYLGVSLTSAGTGLVLPVIAFLAAGASRQKLGATMGGLAAAAGLGQTLGSSVGGWLFGAFAQRSFGWLTLPLVVILMLLLARPGWWSVIPTESTRHPTRLAAKGRHDHP
jgi:MFS family permease